jgi:hypothetical protein
MNPSNVDATKYVSFRIDPSSAHLSADPRRGSVAHFVGVSIHFGIVIRAGLK